MSLKIPEFRIEVIDSGLEDGYWICAADVTGNGLPDLVTSGLVQGRVSWFENGTWKKNLIATLHRPVALAPADISGDGSQDLVVCHDYGESLYACEPDSGAVSWLKNPTHESGRDGEWPRYRIGQLCSAHRVVPAALGNNRAMHVIAAPMVGPGGGAQAITEPVRITAYRRPERPEEDGWPVEVIDDANFSVVHEIGLQKPLVPGPTGHETFMISSPGSS